MSPFRHQRQHEKGFIGVDRGERLVMLAAVAVYAAIMLPMVKRFYGRTPSALFFPLVPPLLLYTAGVIAALIWPSRDPLVRESVIRRGLRFGNVAFVLAIFLFIPLAAAYVMLARGFR